MLSSPQFAEEEAEAQNSSVLGSLMHGELGPRALEMEVSQRSCLETEPGLYFVQDEAAR